MAAPMPNAGGSFSQALSQVKQRAVEIEWEPSNTSGRDHRNPPSLVDLALNVLVHNARAVCSLDTVPYFLRKRFSDRLCQKRRMYSHELNLLMEGSKEFLDGAPIEIRVKNCRSIHELHPSLMKCKTEHLRVMQLDEGPEIDFHSAIRDKVFKSMDSFDRLSIVSLRNAHRLTDDNVDFLVVFAPRLLSINIGYCLRVTHQSVKHIADKLGKQLRELNIEGCENIQIMQVWDEIPKFKALELLSIARLTEVSDGFIHLLVSVCAESLKDLDVAGCKKLTDVSLRAVASHCPGLLGLNIEALPRVTNLGLALLADGCRSIQRLNLGNNSFSDEVIAAFVEISGEFLMELTLSRVSEVGGNTALSLAKRSRCLTYLDVSFCRKISTKAMCLIADSCSLLKTVKIFSCKQISRMILNGHSNCKLRVIGYKTKVQDDFSLPEPDHDVYLRYSPLPAPIDF